MSNKVLKEDIEMITGAKMDQSILLSIISWATKEIAGVCTMDNRFRSRIKDKFCKNYFEGAKISYSKKHILEIDVSIVVFQNYNVPEIAYKVQQNIKCGLEQVVKDVGNINIHVVDVAHEDDIIEQ